MRLYCSLTEQSQINLPMLQDMKNIPHYILIKWLSGGKQKQQKNGLINL